MSSSLQAETFQKLFQGEQTISKIFSKDNAKEIDAMKNFLAALIFLMTFALMNVSFAAQISSDGYFNGIRLWGKVRVVNSFPDIKVQVVDSFPDLRVQKVTSFPDELGKWQFVTSGEDFTIQFVDAFADITIQFVDAFPGF